MFPTMFLREMLIRKVNYLEYDDELLRKFSHPELKGMHIDEIKKALEERGVYVPAPGMMIMCRAMYNVVPPTEDLTELEPKSEQELVNLLRYWLKLNNNKHPDREFRHEVYLKQMIRWSRLPDL